MINKITKSIVRLSNDTKAGYSNIYESTLGEISLRQPSWVFNRSLYEIHCRKGNLFKHILCFNTLKEAEKRITELLEMENNFSVTQDTVYAAFVQKLGKSNYSVDSVTNDIINNWNKFEHYVQLLIQKEIKVALDTDKAGLNIDRNLWNKILELKIKENE